MQNYRLMSMINQNQEQKRTVKVIAPLVGFTSDKNFLDFGDFTIRKIREDVIDSPGLGGITQETPRYEELRELLKSVEITKMSRNEEISLLESYIMCLEYIDSGGAITSPKYKIDELIKTFRLYKTGNIRNYFFIFTTSSYPGAQFSKGIVRLPFPSLEYYFHYSEINDFLTFKKDLTKLIPGEWNKNNRYIGVALRHFNFAKEWDNIEDKIIDYVIALEALYLGEDLGEYSYRLANRSSLMLNETFTKRKDRYKDIKNAYTWRSKIVHGAFDPAENKITDEDIEKIGDFLRISIKKFLNLSKHYKKEKIHKLIDESLFGENEWDNLQKESTELLF